ncbi:MAG: phage holin family protein [Gammaproteobacteria bacterium]|nr:phage holin family protein [Gammaproteobacteria bacterium]
MSDPAPPLDPPRPGLLTSLAQALHTRLDLAAVELEIYLLLLVRLLAWVLAAVACVLLALAFGVSALIVALWDTHRTLGLLAGAGFFILLATGLAWGGLRVLRRRPGVLEGSLRELARDERRLRGGP